MKRMWITACLVVCLTALGGCGGCFGNGGEAPAQEQDQELAEGTEEGVEEGLAGAMEQAGRAMEEATKALSGEEGEAVEPVDFRKLRDLLPDELAGMERTSSEGQKSGVMGIKMSQAEGVYEGDDGRIEVSLIDMGTLRGAAMLGYAWLMAEIDRESDTGFERTTEYRGSPAYEKCEQRGERMNCEYQVVLSKRIIFSLEGNRVTREQMEEARDEMPYGDLEELAKEGT